MRILVAQRTLGEQLACRDQFLDHRAIRVAVLALRRENAFAGEQRDIWIEATVLGNRARYFEAMHTPELEVLFAVTRSCMHEAGARIGSNVFARKQRNVEVESAAAERMGSNHSFWIDVVQSRDLDLGMAGGLIGEVIAEEQMFTRPCKPALRRLHNLVESVLHRRRVSDRAIAGNRPRRGGPDHEGCTLQIIWSAHYRKLHIDRRRGFLVILDLGFSECSLLHWRPHHRPETTIEQVACYELMQLAGDDGFGAEIHRRVGL